MTINNLLLPIQSMPLRNVFMWLMKCIKRVSQNNISKEFEEFYLQLILNNNPPRVGRSYFSFYFHFGLVVYFFPTVKYPFTLNFFFRLSYGSMRPQCLYIRWCYSILFILKLKYIHLKPMKRLLWYFRITYGFAVGIT